MANEFKTIETQEELDAIIKARLDRNTKTVTDEVKKSYEGYLSLDEAKKLTARTESLCQQVDSLTKALTEKETAITDLTAKIYYVLAIPKGDTHEWADRTVEFWGAKFRTVGVPTQGIESLIPLDWNKKVKVTAYE